MSTVQKSIIFDLGAVMVDWNPLLIAQNFTADKTLQTQIVEQLFHHQNWILFDNGQITEPQLITRCAQQINLSIEQIEALMNAAKASLQAKPKMVELLTLAHKTGLKTYCLSNLSHEWYQHLSNWHDFFKLFDGQVISAQENIGKPDSIIFERLIQRYNVDIANCLFIDDRAENTQAAQKLGLKCITFEHSKENIRDIHCFISHKKNPTYNF